MLYCPNFFWNVLQVWMTGKDVYLQMTWSWPDKTWNILRSYCLQWNTSQSKFRNHYFLFVFAFSILSQLFLIRGCSWVFEITAFCDQTWFHKILWYIFKPISPIPSTQPPYNDKDPPSVFFISLNHFPFLISSHSQMPVCVTSHRPRPSHDCWLTLALYLRPALSERSSVRHCFDAGADVDKNGS